MTKPLAVLKKYFGFSSTETYGLIFLIPVLILILIIPRIVKKSLLEKTTSNTYQEQKELLSWYKESQAMLSTNNSMAISTSLFNPNEITSSDWEHKGFSKDVARRIVNYRLKGRDYRKKEELLKIYGINEHLIKAYFPYMIIPKPKKKQFSFPDVKKVVKKLEKKIGIVRVDINEANAIELQRIKGIGPVLSERIVKYRNYLGGFTHVNQLQEVYGIDSALCHKMDSSISPFIPRVQKINLNQDSAKFLAKHPYISYKTAYAIIKYRKQHGDYTDIKEVKNIHLVSDSIFQRMHLYLGVNPME